MLKACFPTAMSALVVLLCAVPPEVDAEGQKPNIEPAAAEVLQAASKHLASAKMLTFRATMYYDVVGTSGIKTKFVRQIRYFVKRPDRLHVRTIRDDGAQRYLWYDGKTLTRYEPVANTSSRMDVPKTIDALLDHLADKFRVTLPLADLLYGDPHAAFSEHLLSGVYLGKRLVDGAWSHHLSFESAGADFQLWITAGDKPILRRFAVTYVNEPGAPELLAILSDWSPNAYLDDSMFSVTPPNNAKQVPFEPRAK
jgi:hypothetical protein